MITTIDGEIATSRTRVWTINYSTEFKNYFMIPVNASWVNSEKQCWMNKNLCAEQCNQMNQDSLKQK